MARLLTGFPVFIALLCGQPDLLGVVCLYLSLLIVLAGAAAQVFREARRLRID